MIDFNTLSHGRVAFFISAENASLSDRDNLARSDELANGLGRLVSTGILDCLHCVDGCYEGAKERAFMFVTDRDPGHDLAKALCERYEQESYLAVRGKLGCLFFRADWDKPELIGQPTWLPANAKRPANYSVLRGFGDCVLTFE